MTRRSNLYGKSQIILGDKTSHGGVVISGSATNSWYGVPISRKGDRVFCPKCKPHIFEIAEGLENCTDTDSALPMATEGHKTTCGAILIAESAGESALKRALNQNRPYPFDEQIRFETPEGKVLGNIDYVITLSNGEELHGRTDQNGLSDRLKTEEKTDIVKVVFDLDGHIGDHGHEQS